MHSIIFFVLFPMATLPEKDLAYSMSLMAENKLESFKGMVNHKSDGSSLQSLVDTYRDSEQISIHRNQEADIPFSSEESKPLSQLVKRNIDTSDVMLKTNQLSIYDPFSTKVESAPFERIECPDIPPPGYPKHYPIKDVLDNWNADDTIIPPMHYDSLCHIDYQKDLEKAFRYRDADLPFVVYNVPHIDSVVEKWSDVDYMNDKLKGHSFRTATSDTNHFMYYNGMRGGGKDWKPPTGSVQMTYGQWLQNAVQNHNLTTEERRHLYFRVSSGTRDTNWLFDELTFFKPEKSLFIKDPRGQRGIHCRYGMRGVIAEDHFDGGRNFIVELMGLRRWVMAHPNQCNNMYMYKRGHPSSRHSMVDWSNPDYEQYPDFLNLKVHEVILRPGDALFMPMYWFHFIANLNINIQCNSRSGFSSNNKNDINKCGPY